MVIPSVTSILLNVLELPPEDASYMPMIMEDAYIIRYRVDAFCTCANQFKPPNELLTTTRQSSGLYGASILFLGHSLKCLINRQSQTIVYFDHAISLDVEIERIWLPKYEVTLLLVKFTDDF